MNLEIFPHEHFMNLAIEQAGLASSMDEVPCGAIIVHDQRIIGSAHNQCRQLRDATAHAEMIAITQASEAIGDWRLEGCTLYATLEPCPMCAGAILQARIPTVVFGAADPKGGAVGSMFDLLTDARLNHQSAVISGVLGQRCGEMLTNFFQAKRRQGKK